LAGRVLSGRRVSLGVDNRCAVRWFDLGNKCYTFPEQPAQRLPFPFAWLAFVAKPPALPPAPVAADLDMGTNIEMLATAARLLAVQHAIC